MHVYSTVHSMVLPWRPLGVRSLAFVKQNSFISSLSNVYYVQCIDSKIRTHVDIVFLNRLIRDRN